jgi:hypothetical protein
MVQGEQPAASAYDKSIGQTPLLAGECAHFYRERQPSVSARKFWSHFGKIQLMSVSCQSIHLHLGDTFRADIRAQSLRNVSRHARLCRKRIRLHFSVLAKLMLPA